MGQIFGNVNDPRARESARGSLPAAPAPTAPTNALAGSRPDVLPVHPEEHVQLQPATPSGLAVERGIGDVLRGRRQDLEKRLVETDRLLDLSQRRASELTLEQLQEIVDGL